MASYLSRIRALTNSTSTQTSDQAVVDFLKSGVGYILTNIPKEFLWFANSNTTFTSSTGVTVPQNTIISVRRNGIECDKLDEKFVYATAITLTSLYAGTTFFPKYYVEAGVVYTDPDPSGSAMGAATYVNLSASLMTSTVTSTGIALSPVENPLIYHAAGLDFQGLAGFWSQLAGDAEDALTKAKVLIDSATNLSAGEDAEYHLDQEDPEMINPVLQIATQEVNRATANLNYYTSKAQLCQTKAEGMFTLADKQIEQYVKSQGGKS